MHACTQICTYTLIIDTCTDTDTYPHTHRHMHTHKHIPTHTYPVRATQLRVMGRQGGPNQKQRKVRAVSAVLSSLPIVRQVMFSGISKTALDIFTDVSNMHIPDSVGPIYGV